MANMRGLRRFLSIPLAAALLAAARAPALAGPQQAKKPNFIVVDICSARADHFGAYGYSRPTTPNMDRLAKQGALFENAIAQSSWCLPNYASLFSGQRAENHGLVTNEVQGLPEFETTLAERLKEGGYRTAAFSGGVYMIPEWGLSRGFDTYVNIFSTSNPSRLPAPVEDNLAGVSDWLAQARSSQTARPFFLYVAVDDLHAPYHADNPGLYDSSAVSLDTETLSVPFARAYSGEKDGYSPAVADKAQALKRDGRGLERLTARYDAALHAVDDRVGALLKRLKRMGLDRDTVVILTADHGEMLGEKGLLGHTQSLYEGVLHVPLIIRDPLALEEAGRRLAEPVERVDLMPTILDRAGLPYLDLDLQGRSLMPLLEGRRQPWRDYAYASSKRNLASSKDPFLDERALRGRRWKLVQYLYKTGFELYDIAADPLETRDLSAQRPDVVSRLSFELLKQVELSRPHQPGRPAKAPDGWSLSPASPQN